MFTSNWRPLVASTFALSLISIGCGAGEHESIQETESLLTTTSIDVPGAVAASVSATGCENSPGPQVTLDGTVSLSDIGARLIFRNNDKGTHLHDEEFATAVQLATLGTVTIPKQPVLGGSGGNPFIWTQFLDAAGNALSDELFMGRCVQGLSDLNTSVALPSLGVGNVQALDCTNNPGPQITVSGSLALPGFIVRLIFRNNDNPVGGPHETDVETHADLAVMQPETIVFQKQPVLGGVGGNPWIYLQFTSGDNVSDEILLGRCVQLLPGN